MSVQFGKWKFDGKPIKPDELEEVRRVLAPFAPDGEGYICDGSFAVLYRAFHTTEESRKEKQPCVLTSGTIITWDGRLDNREELISDLGNALPNDVADVEIVASAYDRWQAKAFAKLLGDWALSVWDAKNRSLILAKDFAGIRPLFYSIKNDSVTWCTVFDPLVLLADHSFRLNKEYVCGWLGLFPAVHLTPYIGIHSVPPASYVRITENRSETVKYWDFDQAKSLRYARDEDYEEHFRSVFFVSVRRRLRSSSPVLAELSGGMDSSAIVCVADHVAGAPLVHTVSYYDDSEPNWNERPFFTLVEQKRGRSGLHINVGAGPMSPYEPGEDTFSSVPNSELMSREARNAFTAHMASNRYRVLLCGIGGDEVLGGVPTPIPELADLLARGRPLTLAHQLKMWALSRRKPWFWLLGETVKEFFPAFLAAPQHKKPQAWIDAELIRRHRAAFRGYEQRLKIAGPLPSFQENLRTLDGLRRQIGCAAPHRDPVYEVRYPYLDRSLLEFLYSIPRDQLVRPGQRRSLMRRAMTGIVPSEVLARRRKAFVARSPLNAIDQHWSALQSAGGEFLVGAWGLVSLNILAETMMQARNGEEVAVAPLLRLLILEHWLKKVCKLGVISPDSTLARTPPMPLEISAEKFQYERR